MPPAFALNLLPDLLERPEAPENPDDYRPSSRRASRVVPPPPSAHRPSSGLTRQPSSTGFAASSTTGLSRQPSSVSRTGTGFLHSIDANAQQKPSHSHHSLVAASNETAFSSGLLAIPNVGGGRDANDTDTSTGGGGGGGDGGGGGGGVGSTTSLSETSGSSPMPLRSRRHSFALDGATLVAAEPAALAPANAALGGSTAHGIRVGDDGRPRHQHAADNDAGGGSSDTASDHGTTAAGGAKKGAEHYQSSTAAGGGVATTTHVVPRAEMGVAGGTPDPATYTPYPATWPSRGDVVRARTSLLGPQAPDMWALPSAPRFSNAEKTQTPIGPSTYAPTRLGTRDHRTPRVLPSSLPRFPPVAGNPRIAPGTYAVDPVPVPHGFRPWVRARVTHAWPPRPSPSAAERKAGVIAGFADARRVVLAGLSSSYSPTQDATSAKQPTSSPTRTATAGGGDTTTASQQPGNTSSSSNPAPPFAAPQRPLHVFSAAFLAPPLPPGLTA
ncbi:hypothetical protein HDU89_005671 [Geranomyces variabilis]|nr:hypothetical protein HDU89_005671 [Geranomyces variabilis]